MPQGEPQDLDSASKSNVPPKAVDRNPFRSAAFVNRLAPPAPSRRNPFSITAQPQPAEPNAPVPPPGTSVGQQSEADDERRGYHQTYGPVVNTGNIFAGQNYGNVTQTVEEFYVLRNLPIHPDVSVHLSDYFPGSRSDDEAHILQWIDSTSPPELVLCVLGKAGVGKSTLAKHLATRLRRDNRLAAEIFLGFALPDWTPESVFRMVAGQLCATYPELKRAVSEAIDLDIGPSVSLETRIRNFILEPIRSLRLGRPLVVLLDALDQWAPHPILIKALSYLAAETHLIRFISFGRPGLEDRFRNVSFGRHDLPDVSKRVMGGYIRQRFEEVRWEYGRKPSSQTIDRLVDKADGLFIWSSTLCSVLEDELSCPKPHYTLNAVLQSQQSIGDNETLANLYHSAINLRFPKPDHKAKLKVFLGAVLALQEPLPITAFASLVSMEVGVVRKIREDLGPLQTGQAQDTRDMVYPASSTFHLSFIEYVQSPDTPPQLAFPIDAFLSHSQLGKACLEELCRIPSSPHPPFMSPMQTYVIKYWPTHIAHGTPSVEPTSDAEWRATPNCAILNSLSVLQWQHWASAYIRSFCAGTTPDLSDELTTEISSASTEGTPYYFISKALKSLLDVAVTAGSVSDTTIAVAEVAVRLQHQRRDAWLDLGKAYDAAAQNTESSLLVEKAVCACRNAAELDDEGDLQTHWMLAACLRLRFSRLGSQDDLNEAISLGRVLLLLTPSGHPERATSLNILALSLDSDYNLTGAVESQNEAIMLYREALLLRPPGHPGRATSLNNLAASCQSHHERTGSVESQNEAIMLYREALLLRPPGHPGRATSLNNLAFSLQSHHERTGSVESLEESIILYRETLILWLPGHPGRAWSLNNLALSLQSHYKLTGTGLEEVIILYQEALMLWLPGHPNRPLSLNNLALSLQSHHQLTGSVESLQEAIVLYRETLTLWLPGHPNRPLSLNNLATSLQLHHQLTGSVESLQEAIVLYRETLTLWLPGHPNRPLSLNNLALCLQSHHNLTGTIESLDEAIMLNRETLTLWLPGHPNRPLSLNNLAASLQSHHELTGSVESLEEVIMLNRETLTLWLPGHPNRALSLNNLALSLQSHHQLTGSVESLQEAIVLYRETLTLWLPGHPNRAMSLNNLAASLQSHHELTGSVESLQEAIVLCQEALSLWPPGHPDRALSLNNLALSLQYRHILTGTVESLQEAIMLYRQAHSLLPHGNPRHAMFLNNLAASLQSHYELTGTVASLDEATVLRQEALSLSFPGHLQHTSAVEGLAESVQESYRLTGNIQERDEALSLLPAPSQAV